MVTLGEAMKLAGYQTALSGKWHLGSGETTHPYRRGFDEYYGLLDGCCNFFNPKQRDPKYKGGRIRKFGHNDRDLSEFPDDYYTTDAFTDHAIECVEKFTKNSKPYFLHINYTAPHYPLHAKPQDIKKYVGKFRMGWDTMREQRYKRLIDMGLIDANWKLSGRDSRAYDWETANHEYEDLRMAVYAAMIDSMDQNIGRLMKAIRAQQGRRQHAGFVPLRQRRLCRRAGRALAQDRSRAERVLRGSGAVLGLGAKLTVSPLQKLGARGRHRHAVHRLVAGPSAARGHHKGGRAYHRLHADISRTGRWQLSERVQGEQNPSGRGQESRERAAWPDAKGPQATGVGVVRQPGVARGQMEGGLG